MCFVSISLRRFAPMNGGLLLQAHWGREALFDDVRDEETCMKSVRFCRVSALLQSERYRNKTKSVLRGNLSTWPKNLFLIKTDVGLGAQTEDRGRIGCLFIANIEWGSEPACSLVLSNRSIRRSALLRSSLRSSSSWLIRPWEERNTWTNHHLVNIYIALICNVYKHRGHDELIPRSCG